MEKLNFGTLWKANWSTQCMGIMEEWMRAVFQSMEIILRQAGVTRLWCCGRQIWSQNRLSQFHFWMWSSQPKPSSNQSQSQSQDSNPQRQFHQPNHPPLEHLCNHNKTNKTSKSPASFNKNKTYLNKLRQSSTRSNHNWAWSSNP